jgi:glutaredoxin
MVQVIRWTIRILAGAAAAALAFSAAAQLYRWTDETGKTHFTDTPPPKSAKNVQKQAQPPKAQAAPPEPFVLQQARKNYPVKLYSSPGCEACTAARKLLNARGIPFDEVSVSDEASNAELKTVSGSNSVPVMVVGATVQKGYEAALYERLLDAAGYPKTGTLPPRNQAEPGMTVEPRAEEKPAEAAVRGPYAVEEKPGAPPKPGPYLPVPPRR